MIFYSWSAAQKRVLLPPRQQVFWFNFNCWLDIYHKTPWSVESRHLLPTQLHLQQRRVKKLVKLSGRIFIVCWITNWKKNYWRSIRIEFDCCSYIVCFDFFCILSCPRLTTSTLCAMYICLIIILVMHLQPSKHI